MTGIEQFIHDLRNVAVIAVSALAGMIGTAAAVEWTTSPGLNAPPAPSPGPARAYEVRGHALSGADRLFGAVRTRDGEVHRGFIRWDRNEGSWGDLLDATKMDRGFSSVSGIRFGHIESVVPVGSNLAVLHLRSGQEIGMESRSTDLGRDMRSLVVTRVDDGPFGRAGERVDVKWTDVRRIDFEAAPADARPYDGRMHGTVTTGRGLEFTGLVAWDVDEIFAADVLDGDVRVAADAGDAAWRDGRAGVEDRGRRGRRPGRRHWRYRPRLERLQVPFAAIHSIEHNGLISVAVELHDGERLVMGGTNDVDRSNRGVTVSDPGLGQVTIPWESFSRVQFSGPGDPGTPDAATHADFDGGRPLRGTVITMSGEALAGDIRWDDDEHRSWELLNGASAGVDFQIEFSKIDRIARTPGGAEVTLRDGRGYELSGSNDVDSGNRGIVVTSPRGGERVVEWSDFRELRLGATGNP